MKSEQIINSDFLNTEIDTLAGEFLNYYPCEKWKYYNITQSRLLFYFISTWL